MAAHSFAQIPEANISRSTFNRSHGYKTTFDAGKLIPFFVDEVLPGDTFNLKVNMFCRLATPVYPVMDNIYLDTFFFFVPNRLIWDNWEKFMGARENPNDSIDYIVPQMYLWKNGETILGDSVREYGYSGSYAFPIGSVGDYLGLPSRWNTWNDGNGVDAEPSSAPDGWNLNGIDGSVNALPFRAINLIWNEWFRDENLQDSLEVEKGDGPERWTSVKYPLPDRGKRHDYFTSALPWPQKGPGIDLPLGPNANIPVVGIYDKPLGLQLKKQNPSDVIGGIFHLDSEGTGDTFYHNVGVAYGYRDRAVTSASLANSAVTPGVAGSTIGVASDPTFSGLRAIYSADSTLDITINSLRESLMLQQLLERDARGGTRYKELLLSHFGVSVPDYRLQRPEYLGGSSGLMNIHQVAQTASTNETSPQGNLAAYGIFSDSVHGFSKSFVEHGYVIGFVCARADLSYQQGQERFWNRKTRFDYYWPSLAHLGEQEVLQKEIFSRGVPWDAGATDEAAANDSVFGYQERSAEYRYKQSYITGKLRTAAVSGLDAWHLAQFFSNSPALNDEFIRENPPIDRVIAVPDEPQFIFDAWFDLNCVRPMPVYGIPGFQAHF